jgi:phage baseplate assembly protein W
MVMAYGYTIGINFPFRDSVDGKYLDLSLDNNEEIRSNLIHLILTRKGSRYYLPDFGTRLYEYLFEPMDGPTFSDIESEIRDSVGEYIPGITITNISIKPAAEDGDGNYVNGEQDREVNVSGFGQMEHTARVRIDYIITEGAFNASDFIILNI